MKVLTKSLSIVAVAFAMAAVTNLAQAGCGTCEPAGEHKHEKAACVRCEHEKACDKADCNDPAHQAKCSCEKKHKH